MSEHTAGPWGFMFNAEWTDNFLLGPEDEERPGECFGTFLEGGMVLEDDAKNLANARLIAAAPDLLSVLKRVQYALGTPAMGSVYEIDRLMPDLRAAILKATGEKP